MGNWKLIIENYNKYLFATSLVICHNADIKAASTATALSSPVGTISLIFTEKGLQEVRKVNKKSDQILSHKKGLNKFLKELHEYFKGTRKSFDLSLDIEGTAFQKAVWKATEKIPYGKTLTYADIAAKIGRPNAVRAVGTALGKNPVCIVVPCHRVVPKSGGVGQYAYGSTMKQWLIDFERTQVSH